MEIIRIKKRNIVFRHQVADWYLNLHLIMGSRRNYLIDTGLGSLSVAPVVDFLGADPKPLIIVNTHHHWDHIWGNHVFDGGLIVSHRLCRDLIASKWTEMLDKKISFAEGEARLRLPDTVFDDFLYFADDKIRLIYTPGHTADSISVLDEEEGVMNIGDNIGDDLDEIVPSLETEKEEYLSTLQKYGGIDFDTCVSGHNTMLGRDALGMVLAALG